MEEIKTSKGVNIPEVKEKSVVKKKPEVTSEAKPETREEYLKRRMAYLAENDITEETIHTFITVLIDYEQLHEDEFKKIYGHKHPYTTYIQVGGQGQIELGFIPRAVNTSDYLFKFLRENSIDSKSSEAFLCAERYNVVGSMAKYGAAELGAINDYDSFQINAKAIENLSLYTYNEIVRQLYIFDTMMDIIYTPEALSAFPKP